MRIHLLVLLMALSLLAYADTDLDYSFESGTEGWASVLESTDPDMAFDRQPASSLLRLSSFGISVSDGDAPHRDSAQNHGLLFRSPEFQFDTIEDAGISFQLGSGSEDNLNAPSHDDEPSLTEPSSEAGYVGLLLRNVTSGEYLISSQRTTSPSSTAETITWSTAELSGLINTEDPYTLDLVDLRHGPWGWISLDNVSISGGYAVTVFADGFEQKDQDSQGSADR
jgi:hypothetical protein